MQNLKKLTCSPSRSGQKGALSLRLTALCVALFAFTMMAGLFYMRYERNLFAEVWAGIQKSTHKLTQQAVQQTSPDILGTPSSEIIKCKVNGKWVYSNSECKGTNIQKIEIHDSAGFDAPKVAQPVKDTPEQLREKMLERAIEGK